MAREGFQRHESHNALPIDHGRVQARLAEYAFKIEHPGVVVGRNEIMMDWVREHAADWRKVISEHEGESVPLNDEAVIEKFYREMLSKHGESGDQTIH